MLDIDPGLLIAYIEHVARRGRFALKFETWLALGGAAEVAA